VCSSDLFSAGFKYKAVITDSLGNPAGPQWDNLSGLNDVGATNSSFVVTTTPYTFINASSFSVPGDQRSAYSVGRRFSATVTAGTVYGTIVTSTFAGGVTTIVAQMDPTQALDAGLSSVSLGAASYLNNSNPTPNPASGSFASAASINLEIASNYGDVITGTTTITSVTLAQGQVRTLVAQTTGLTIQPGGSLVTETGRNIVCAAGDRLTFTALNGNVYVSIIRSVYPNFLAWQGAQTLSAITLTKMTLSNATTNDGGGFNTATSTFTPTVPGRYLFLFNTSATATNATGTTTQFNLFLNGAQASNSNGGTVTETYIQNTPGNISFTLQGLIDMNGTTDNVQVFNSGVTAGASVSTTGTTFIGFKIDP